MENLSKIGRIFYGIAMAGIGFQAIYYGDFPYMLIPPKHSWIPGLMILAYIFGTMLILAGLCIVFEIKPGPVSLLLGTVLLLIFCFYFVPYQLIFTSNYTQLVAWENAEKELALASGAFIIAGCYAEKNSSSLTRNLAKLIPLGIILFCIPVISFGIDHFLYAKEVAEYIPAWVPIPVFWTYFAGAALLASGIAIMLNIKRQLAATLLGIMIFIWVIMLHIPKSIDFPFAGMGGEVTSAFLALAYSGIAFVIAGGTKNSRSII